MANPSIGKVFCPFHEVLIPSQVKRDKNKKLYYWCPECGPVQPHGDSFQEWMLEKAVIINPNEEVSHAKTSDDRRRKSSLEGEDGRRQSRQA